MVKFLYGQLFKFLLLEMTLHYDLPAMDGDRPFLSKLFFGFMHLANEIYKPFSRFRNSLLWPIRKLKLSDCP